MEDFEGSILLGVPNHCDINTLGLCMFHVCVLSKYVVGDNSSGYGPKTKELSSQDHQFLGIFEQYR